MNTRVARILYKSSDVRKEVINLFSSAKARRVAITAFVGAGAESYLPTPKGIELVCWPKAGGTNPHALRRLINKGVKVSFSDSVHMKVYWAEGRGAVITSANLSTNALGSGGLKEVGVLIPKRGINIDRLLVSLHTRPVTDSELRKLDRLHNEFVIRNRGEKRTRPQTQTYKTWYDSPSRATWKLGWWDDYLEESCYNAKKVSQKEYNVAEPNAALTCRKGDYKRGEWVLSFRLTGNRASSLGWMFVDHVVARTRAEMRQHGHAYPNEAIQIWPPARYPERPFRIDTQLRRAFSAAVKDYGPDKLTRLKSPMPPKQLLESVRERL